MTASFTAQCSTVTGSDCIVCGQMQDLSDKVKDFSSDLLHTDSAFGLITYMSAAKG